MEKRYIDALTEICGTTSVLYEMSDMNVICMMKQKNMFAQRLVRTVSLFVRALMKKYLKFLNGQTKNSCRLSLEVAVQVPAVQLFRQSHL